MQGQSVKTYENPCNLIIGNYSNHLKTSTQSTNYHHYYYPTCHPLETPSTTINPVTINIIENNNSKIDPDSLLPCLHLSSIMTGSNKISIESLTNNSSGHLKNSTTTTTTIGNNLINNNNNLTNNNNNINSNMNHIHNNQTNINHNCINTINSSVNNSINNVNGTLNNHSNYTTTNKLMMKLLPWCKLKRKQFVFRDSLSCDDISSVMFRRSSVQPISGLFNDKNYQLTTITSSSSSPSTSTMTTSTSVTPSSSSITSSSHSTTSSSSMTMARLFTGKRNSNNNKSNGNLNSILSYTMTNRKRNCHNNSITNGHSGSSISSYPMVSFVNKGEGLVTVDSTFDRILMSNENELYSLGSAINNPHHHSHHPSSTSSSVSSSFNSFSNGSSSLSSSKSMGNLGANYGPSCSRINSSTYSTSDCDLPSVYGSMGANELPPWFYGPICRDNAIDILARQPIGSFLVRESISKPGCYALSVRVPKRFQVTGVAHYLIIRSSQGTFKIKGFTKEFSSLNSLIVHHSIMQELLPCPLDLSTIKIHQHKNSQTIIINSNEAQTQLIEETAIPTDSTSTSTTTTTATQSATINSTSSTTITTASSSSSSSTITPTINSNYDYNDDLLVDIDSDPDYQRILTSFRKTMATCR